MDNSEIFEFEQSVSFFSKFGGKDYISPENAGS